MGLALRLGLGFWGVSSSALSAALSLDFTTGTLDPRITFSRASSGTYFDASGVLQLATTNTARFDYDPATFMAQGLLVEEQRTNLLLRSEEFDNASWVKATATVTANATTSPDGTVDADKVIVNTGVALGTSTAAGLRQSVSKAASAITYTYTAYLKVGEFNSAFLWMSNAGVTASVRCTFNLAAGTASATTTTGSFTGASATITAVGNGWYRCTLIATSDTDTTVRCDIWPSDTVATTGDGTSGIYVWGAQLEAGSFATSYIPTAGSQVTRAADQASIVAPNFASWYNQSEGTFVVEAATQKPTSLAATVIAIDASDGGINNRHYIGVVSASAEVRTVNGGSVQSTIIQAYSANSVEKYAYAVKANDFAFARNGSIVGTDTSGSMPTINRMFIGNAAGSAAYFNGHIKSITFYNTRLPDATLQSLTT